MNINLIKPIIENTKLCSQTNHKPKAYIYKTTSVDTFQKISFTGQSPKYNNLEIEDKKLSSNVKHTGSISIKDSVIGDIKSVEFVPVDFDTIYDYEIRNGGVEAANRKNRSVNNHVTLYTSEVGDINAGEVTLWSNSSCDTIIADKVMINNNSKVKKVILRGNDYSELPSTIACKSVVDDVDSMQWIIVDDSTVTNTLKSRFLCLRGDSVVNNVISYPLKNDFADSWYNEVHIQSNNVKVKGKIEFKDVKGIVFVPEEGIISPNQVINGEIQIKKN